VLQDEGVKAGELGWLERRGNRRLKHGAGDFFLKKLIFIHIILFFMFLYNFYLFL